VQELLAILDYHESRNLAANGKDAEAADGLIRATEVLKRLSIQRPDATILQSELASCFLSSATILDGIGLMGDARDTRTKAAEILVSMLKEDPGDLDIRVDLAGCYGEIAAAALMAGDVAGTESSSRQAVKLLEEVKSQRPEDPDVRSLLAAQRWIMARIVRDRGDAAEALRLTDDGIQMIEGIAVNEAGDPVAKYRLALLFWQKGLLLSTANRQEQAIDYQTRSAEMLRKLVGSDYGLVRSEQIRRSLGYVLGDLGHAARLAKKPELAQAAFGEAVAVWSILNRERPQNEEYEECLAWSQQRLKGP
jgi:tetratricopeptide (TPR) repeat protein